MHITYPVASRPDGDITSLLRMLVFERVGLNTSNESIKEANFDPDQHPEHQRPMATTSLRRELAAATIEQTQAQYDSTLHCLFTEVEQARHDGCNALVR